MWLTLAAIRRPVWVFMVMVATLVLGFIALNRLPVEENPDVDFPFITVQTSYFGAGSEEIETLITKPIEDAVTTVSGIENITSVSLEGASIVSIQFELKVNQDTALSDVKSKVDSIVGLLPRDAEKPVVSKLNISSQPILFVAAESDTLNPLDLRDLVDERISDRLARIPGVADVEITGGQEREIRVALDKNRLESIGIGVTDVLGEIQGATLNVPGGNIVEGRRETAVRVQGEFESVDELRELVIPVADNMNPGVPPAIVRLQDVATVIDGPKERTQISRINGRDAVLIAVQRSREGNTVEITERVKHELETLEKEFPIKFTITQESAKQVEESIEDLTFALIIAVFLVTGIIYLFLHNLRGTLIVALAIPTCLFAAFGAISLFGFTLNTMSMLGLSLAVGILVDDAIVVLENIYRHLAKGEAPMEAALNGRMEIGLAAVAITAVDLVIFLPVAFMGGIIGEFFRPFALTVAAATLFSLFVSFTLTPMLASRWYRKGENLENKRGFGRWFDNRFYAFANGYRGLLARALKRRWLVFMAGWAFLMGVFMMIAGGAAGSLRDAVAPAIVMAAVALGVGALCFLGSVLLRKANFRIVTGAAAFALALVAFGALGFLLAQNKGGPLFTERFGGSADSGVVNINITMPPGSSLERTLEAVERVEQAALAIPEAEFVTSRLGVQASGFGPANVGSQYSNVILSLTEKKALIDSFMFWSDHGELRTRHQNEIATELQQNIGRIPDARIVVSGESGFGFGPPVQVALLSTDPESVAPAAVKAQSVIEEIPGIVNVELSSKPGKPEMLIKPDRISMADKELSVASLGSVARVVYEGDTSAKYREGGREYDIRVNLADDVSENSLAVAGVPVTFRQGNPVYIGDVAAIEPSLTSDKIERYNRQRQITVVGYLLPGYVIGTVGNQIEKSLAEVDLGENVAFAQRGENEIQAREFPYMLAAFGLGIVLVFFVLASLFNNIVYPLIIQLAQPQALVGALLALMIFNRSSDVVAMIGIIMLVGLVGKNAILLVDYTNTLRARGMERNEAILEAAPTRLRPILMTTLALVLAMVPVAVALGRGSEFRAPLGIVIIGGLTLSTLLTLFIIPASYTLFDDLSRSVARLFRRRAEADVETNGGPEMPEPEPALKSIE